MFVSTAVVGCDLNQVTHPLCAAGSSDHSCRVWNWRTERLWHKLVGHSGQSGVSLDAWAHALHPSSGYHKWAGEEGFLLIHS
jgi:hypothetical protein